MTMAPAHSLAATTLELLDRSLIPKVAGNLFILAFFRRVAFQLRELLPPLRPDTVEVVPVGIADVVGLNRALHGDVLDAEFQPRIALFSTRRGLRPGVIEFGMVVGIELERALEIC